MYLTFFIVNVRLGTDLPCTLIGSTDWTVVKTPITSSMKKKYGSISKRNRILLVLRRCLMFRRLTVRTSFMAILDWTSLKSINQNLLKAILGTSSMIGINTIPRAKMILAGWSTTLKVSLFVST